MTEHEINKLQKELENKSIQEVQEELKTLINQTTNKSVLIWTYQHINDINTRYGK